MCLPEKLLAHCLKPSIRQYDVVLLLEGIISKYWTKDIVIRNDNGSQFIAHSVRRYLKYRGISQQFTHIATPEENAYFEALHSTLEREVIQRYWFAKACLRLCGDIVFLTPALAAALFTTF